jgi:hypothetical protein
MRRGILQCDLYFAQKRLFAAFSAMQLGQRLAVDELVAAKQLTGDRRLIDSVGECDARG